MSKLLVIQRERRTSLISEEEIKLDIRVVSVNLLENNTNMIEAELHIYEEAPHNNKDVLLEVYFNAKKISKNAEDFFSALQEIRKELEKESILILCNGSALNIYPSPMQRTCSKAYVLELGFHAKLANMVDIFDNMEGLTYATVDEQEEFYNKWIDSPKKHKDG